MFRTCCVGLVLAACLAAAPGLRAQPVTIGVLTDLSGTSMDFTGPGSVAAVQMAVEDWGGSVLGRPVKVISGDHQLKADVGAAIARRWYDEDVSLIVDVPASVVGLAVQGVAAVKHRLYITTGTLTSDFTGKFCNPYSMQWTTDNTAIANATVSALVQRGLTRWFFLTADYAFGLALQSDASRVLQASGGQLVGSVRHPFNSSDLTSFVLQGLSSDAQAIALANGPPDNTIALKEATEFGLKSSGKSLVGLFFTLTDIHGLGLDTAQGLIFTEPFYWDLNDATRAWSRRFQARMNKMPTSAQAADYSATLHWLKAVQAANTLDADAVAAKMRELPVEDMFAGHGQLRVDGLMLHDLYLVQVKAPAESKEDWDFYKVLQRVDGTKVFPRLEDEGCSLVTPPR